MPSRRQFIAAAGSAVVFGPVFAWMLRPHRATARSGDLTFPVVKADAAWRAALTKAQYRVLRGGGTEWANSSPLNSEKRAGTFRCAGCEHPLFSSATKFDSHTGWPSFWQPLDGAVETTVDRSWLMVRTEVLCARCGGHLGHVFPDGPPPTGLRYCINGVALSFLPTA
jgi:peptide-methionine (R)-S-oxide reductase